MDKAIIAAYQIPGWCYPTELAIIKDLVKQSKLHIEIGSYCGKSLYATGHGITKNARIIAVDPCKFEYLAFMDFYVPSDTWIKNTLHETIKAILQNRPDIKIDHWEMSSLTAAIQCREQKISPTSVYIDGDHNYAEVTTDIYAWYSLLEPGGIIFGHDYWPRDAGVMDAVNEIFEDRFVVFDRSRIWYAEKPIQSESNQQGQVLMGRAISEMNLDHQ